jgi:rSAM/selenodomain-associated transferase 2
VPSVSFVIPVLNEGEGLAETLGRLRDGFPDAERIVIDGGSSDDTVSLSMRGAHCVLLSPAGRAVQMNLGAAAARSDYLCFLHADTQPCFTQESLVSQQDPEMGWGFCRIRLRSPRVSLRVISAFMNARSRITRVATGDQMLVVERSLFESINGYARIPLMEDVELCKRLRTQVAPRVLPLLVTSSARRWEQRGVLSTVLRMWLLRLAYWLGVSPERLWDHYYGAASDTAPSRSR